MIRSGVRRVLRLALRRRDRWEQEVEDEIKLHLTLRAEQYAAEGRAPDEAYDEAVRRFGSSLKPSRARLIAAASRRERTMQQTEFFGELRQDLAFALRTLGRQKMWTAVTVLTLALGIGATTAVFSVVSTLLIHRLPYPHGDRVVVITQQPTNGNHTGISVSILPAVGTVEGWQHDARSFESIQAMSIVPRSLTTAGGGDSRAWTAGITPGFFDFAAAHPIRGRIFTQDEVSSDARVALLAEGFWRARLGADSSVLGKQITLGDTAYTVIGVMPAGFRVLPPGRSPTEVWLPLNLHGKVRISGVVGRLREGASATAAQRELDSIFARVNGFANRSIPFESVVAKPSQGVTFRDSLLLLMGAVGLLLFVACTNVAHLLLARTAARRRELAIRTALGAGSGRLFRQLLTESALVCVAGTLAGLGFGWLGVKALVALRPSNQSDLVATHIDGTTLEVALGVTLLSALIFGAIGIIESRRHSTNDTLKSSAIATSATRGHRRLRTLLVVSEIALSVVLIVGAGLVIRSLQRLQQTDVGFDATNLYTVVPAYHANDGAANTRTTAATFERVRALPGIVSATIADAAPGTTQFSVGRLEIDGEPPPPESSSSFVSINAVQTNYFATMRMRFVEGGTFADTTDGQAVIVNELFARKHWQHGQALGKRVRIVQKAGQPWFTVVGVVHDAMTNGPSAATDGPMFYFPRTVNSSGTILARSTNRASLFSAIRDEKHEHGFADARVETVSDFLSQSISEPRFVMLVMTAFGFVGLLLASIGLYGVMAYTVAQESRDIGVRVALGASRGHVMRSVLARGTALALTGVVVGLAGAVWGTKLVEHHLFGIERLDPASFVGGAVVLISAALLACIVPTRRALAVDPIAAIRAD